jgi:Phage capsid family
MPPTAVLERRRASLAEDLAGIVTEAEQAMSHDDFDPEADSYVALREDREQVEGQLADVIATMNARRMADSAPPRPVDGSGAEVSQMRQVLREYDRGMSERFDVEYQILRAYQVLTTNPASGTAMFQPTPTRVQVAEVPIITPTLDSIRTVQTTGTYDFTVPPPPVTAATVPEGQTKPGAQFVSAKVSGTLETDAHIIDVTRQTLEDDATAENTLKNWLRDGVRLRQDAKAAAAIAGATGTQTADAETPLASIRKGKAELSKIGIRATTVYMNPDDAAAADLEGMVSGHTGPEGLSVIWGMTVVENPGIAAGISIVGAMPQAVYLCYKNAINTYITDSGMTKEAVPRDRFENNILGILGEGRSKAHVVQPKLLVKCTITPVVP